TRHRPRRGPWRSGRLPPPSRHLLPASCRTSIVYGRQPEGELGGWRAPTIPVPSRLHHRRPWNESTDPRDRHDRSAWPLRQRWLATTSGSWQQQRRTGMGKIIMSENVSLDGVIEDPAGDEGFRVGGWGGRIA